MASHGFTVTDREILLVIQSEVRHQNESINSICIRLDKIEAREITTDRLQLINNDILALRKLNEDYERRIRVLEAWRWYTLGMSGVIVIIMKEFFHI